MQTTIIEREGLTWIDVTNPSKKELDELAKRFGLPRAVVKDAMDPSHLPKNETFDSGEFVLLRHFDDAVMGDSEADTIQELTRKIAIFCRKDLLITIHRKSQEFLKRLSSKWSVAPGAENLVEEIRLDLVREVILSYELPLRGAEEVFEKLEHQVFSSSLASPKIEELYFLKRQGGVYRRMLRQNMDVVYHFASSGLRPSQLQDVREEAERVFLHADELVEDLNHLFATHISLASHHTNETVRLLTVMSVFFMPLTFLVGVYGMNFRYMPELELKWGYPAMWVLMLGVTAVIYLWFKRNGWLNFESLGPREDDQKPGRKV